jgi:predicted HicB family RNase H-like nuclease
MAKRKSKPGSITLNFPVSDELHTKVASSAASEGMSISAWVRKVLGSPPLRKYRKGQKTIGVS